MKNADVIFGNEVQVWGRNAVIGITPWEELYAYDQPLDWNAILDAAYTLDMASSSASDAAAGTGARTVRVFGLDANFLPKSLDVTLTGQTMLSTTGNTFRRVFGIEVLTVGSGGVNAGDIHCVKTGTGGTWTAGVPGTLTGALCKVLVGYGASLNGMWTTPAGTKYKVKSLWVSARAQAITLGLFGRVVGANPLLAMTPVELNASNSRILDFEQLGWKVWFDEKTDILLRVFAAAASAVASAGMKLVRIP